MSTRKATVRQFVEWKIVEKTIRGYKPSYWLYRRKRLLFFSVWVLKVWGDSADMLEQYAADFDKRAREFDRAEARP